jgi:RNA polymerase sigma-70 factor (ECF subfamily)
MQAQGDEELVRQSLLGRTEAFEELVRRWAPRILAVCHSRVGRAGMAEDLAQETLLRGFRSLKTLAEPAKFGAWLQGIAHRACLDWLKAKERTTVTFSSLGMDGRGAEDLARGRSPAGEPELDREDELRNLMEKVESLSEELREVLMLFYYQDLKYREIAQVLGVSAATVNARLTRARVLLRERVQSSRG